MSESLEQKARDLLDRLGVENVQNFTAGDLVELANMFNRIAEIEAQLAAVQKDAAWRPIESAPKDETLLGFVPHSMGGYLCPIAHSASGGWFNASCIDFSRVKPSHWKPASYPSIDAPIAGEAP